MKTKYLILIFIASTFTLCNGQTIPVDRICNWKISGLRDTNTTKFITIDLQKRGLIADGKSNNDSILHEILKNIPTNGAILNFGSGIFLFNKSIALPNNAIIKGMGADKTELIFDQKGKDHSIIITGAKSRRPTSIITKKIDKDSNYIYVKNPNVFNTNDWLILSQNDTHLITSSWAKNTVGQVLQIKKVIGNKLILNSPLRLSISLKKSPALTHFNPISNVGIECLKITRKDNTAPQQSSNIYYYLATNCWTKGIESENCTFSHIQARRSSNISITNSYFHHGFDYGGGGRAYGIMLHATSNECLIENNIFKHLRHSMIVQSGANGNVFAYNYSTDPFWSSVPSNSAGDMVLHGNYPFLNLFEQNICANIIIDDSHGKNGKHNTFFRNRAELFGVFFSKDNSPYQNIVGNEIPNKSFPYNLVNYNVLGKNHFLYGNNNKGTISPKNTETLKDISYYRETKPNFIPKSQWAKIGTPYKMGSGIIPAKTRFDNKNIFEGMCGNTIGISNTNKDDLIKIYPNPAKNILIINSNSIIKHIKIFNISGQIVWQKKLHTSATELNIQQFKAGIYFVKIELIDGKSITKKILF